MVIWSILDKCNFILDWTGGPGLAGPEIPNFWAVERSSAARYSSWRRPGKSAARETGVHAWFLGVQHRIIRMANFISVGFTYKHADGNLTRITRQLSVPAPFKNESESMAHMKNKYIGCWCVVRQAQMQPWFWRHFCFHVLSSRIPISSDDAKLISK